MPDFTTKMHQIRFGWGAAPDPAGVAHGAPLDPLAEFWGRVGKELGRVRGLEREENGEGTGSGKRSWIGEGENKRVEGEGIDRVEEVRV